MNTSAKSNPAQQSPCVHRASTSLNVFKRKLKTHLFTEAFN